jgi:hypothetical protein
MLAPLVAGAALGPRYGGTASLDLSVAPGSFAPRAAASLEERALLGLVHETLVRPGEAGRIEPDLARRIEPAASGREWTIRLPEGSFHDGAPITPAAVSASLGHFLASPSLAARRFQATLDGEAGIRAGEGAISLRFGMALAEPLAPLASLAAAVTDPDGAGCGPFTPLVPVPGSVVQLPAYAGHVRGRPLLDGVRVRVGPPEAGQLHLDPDLAGPPAATLLLVLDSRRPPFDAPEARQRAAGALPEGDLTRTFLRLARPARGLFPLLADPLPVPPPGLLAGPALTFRLSVAADVPASASQRVVALWGAAGLRAEVALAAPGMTDPAAPARLLVWRPEVAEPGLALRELAALVPAPAAVGEALDAAERLSGSERAGALARADALLRADRGLLPLAFPPAAWRVDPRLHGVTFDALGRPSLEDAWIEP